MVVHIVLIISMVVGILLIILSLKMASSVEPSNSNQYLEVENTIRAIDSSIEDADNAISQINNLSKSVFEEFEEKYQELLFLYSLIDEKKKEVSELYSRPLAAQPQPSQPQPKMPQQPLVKNPYFEEILKLQAEGVSISDISRRLDLGQGEVKLILELGKDR